MNKTGKARGIEFEWRGLNDQKAPELIGKPIRRAPKIPRGPVRVEQVNYRAHVLALVLIVLSVTWYFVT